MIVAKDKNGIYRTVSRMYSGGKEIAECRDNSGKLVFKNWNELTDIPPLTFKSRSGYLKDYRISGNTIQNGTPTPDNPVEVLGCGERTENLAPPFTDFISGYVDANGYIHNASGTVQEKSSMFIPIFPNQAYTFSYEGGIFPTGSSGYWSAVGLYDANQNFITRLAGSQPGTPRIFTTTEETAYVRISYRSYGSTKNTMFTLGDTAPTSYIPYGYKIPMTVANGTETITTPVYIGSEPIHKIGNYADYAVRKSDGTKKRFDRIKKLVLTGKENYQWNNNATYLTLPYTPFVETDTEVPSTNSTKYMKCSHFQVLNSSTPVTSLKYGMCSYGTGKKSESNFGRFLIGMDSATSAAFNSIKNFIAEQYEAGTPVTVWYVLAEPEEEPLENLLPIQTIKGTNILTVDTEVQPSEMYIKYKK